VKCLVVVPPHPIVSGPSRSVGAGISGPNVLF
jgi:hypothetical protein